MMISIRHTIQLFLNVLIVIVVSGCGGGGGGGSSTRPSVTASLTTSSVGAKINDPNVVALYMDAGPAGANGITNIMYATIQVCAPGTTNCAVVDHVLVDTGSTGLRLLASALPSAVLSALPAVTIGSNPVGECVNFVLGFTWGGVRQLDLHLGGNNYTGETASNISTQIIADPASQLATIPVSCIQGNGRPGSYTGSPTDQAAISTYETNNEMQTAAQLGANGIIGIGLFQKDCGTACVTSATYAYQACPNAGNCSNSTLPLALQVGNPISAFAVDTNGSTIILPTLPSGYADSVSGMLVFGVATQNNNALASGSTVIGALPYSAGASAGTFTASVNGVNGLTGSYIDSGTNWNYFPATGTVTYPDCSNGATYLCPPAPITQVAALTGTFSTTGNANIYTANIDSISKLDPNASAILGLATSSSTNVVLGGSFFFGRSITTLIENQSAITGFSATGGFGPAYAYTP